MSVDAVDEQRQLRPVPWHRLCVRSALPTSWTMVTGNGDDFTARMFDAINGMLLDMLAAVARKDYDDRRRRQAQGQARAKAEGRMKGRPENLERNQSIVEMLDKGCT